MDLLPCLALIIPFINQLPSGLLHLFYAIGICTLRSLPSGGLVQMVHIKNATMTVHSCFPNWKDAKMKCKKSVA